MIERAWLTRGPLALALLPLALLYAAVVKLRHAAFDLGWARVHRLDVPVVVIGNLIAGGAGKTPTVIAVASILRDAGWHPGIVSRGYGRVGEGLVDVATDTPPSQSGDEPLLLRRRLGLPVVVGRDRVAAARLLRESHPEVDVILTDDGLQHRRLGRDVEIVVFDERGIGNGWPLPAGPLREGFAQRPGAALVLYNASSATTAWPGFTATRRLLGAVSLADWTAGREATPDVLTSLAGRPLVAVAGTARPERFFDMLRAAGLRIATLPMPDHDRFVTLPWSAQTPDVVVTEKDAVKIATASTGATRVWVVPLDFRPEPAFARALLALLAARGRRTLRHASPVATHPETHPKKD